MFEAALDKKELDSVEEEVRFIRGLVQNNQDFNLLMTHPEMTEELKEAGIRDIFESKVTDTMMGFLQIVIRKGRFSDIEAIFDYTESRIKEYKRIGVVFVKSAFSLDDDEKKSIEQRLLEVTTYKTFEMHYQVDESLIAGIVIRIGDRVLDNSVASKLASMKRKLSNIQMS